MSNKLNSINFFNEQSAQQFPIRNNLGLVELINKQKNTYLRESS